MFRRFLATHLLSNYSFRSDFLPSVEDRAFWDSFQNETCVEEAETALDYEWRPVKATDFMEFKKSGNRQIMETIHFERRDHLCLFALAELKENRGRFLPQLVNGLFAVCEETYWGLSAHWHGEVGNIPSATDPYIDLYAAETGEHLAVIVTVLREPLLAFCPEIVERIEHELNRRIKLPYETHDDYWWMGNGDKKLNNWTPWILSNVLTIYLLTEGEGERLSGAVAKILGNAQNYYNGIPSDGGCDEGSGYWNRAGASLFELLYQLKCATDGQLDLFDDEKLRRIASYIKKAHMVADIFVNVADSHARGKSLPMLLLFGFARETKQEELMNFSAAVWRDRTSNPDPLEYKIRTLRRLIYHSELLREIENYKVAYPLHGTLEYLPDIELAVLRKGDMILSAKGGFNHESHNHNDVGSFALYEGTTPILVDVGINAYSRFTFLRETRYTMIPWTQSTYHNLPIVGGLAQAHGDDHRADRFEATEEGISISFPGAYSDDACLSGLVRELTLSDSSLLVRDSFDFKDGCARRVDEVLMCVLPVELCDNVAIIGGGYRISASTGSLRCETIPFEDAGLTADWRSDHVTRIFVECDEAKEITMKVEKI